MILNPRAIALHGIGFGPRIIAVQGFSDQEYIFTPPEVAEDEEQKAAGAGRRHYLERTSRHSDGNAYDRDRVAERLQAVVINGKAYDPFTPGLIEILEAAAKVPEPQEMPEIERQERKLSRVFTVKTENRTIKVPLFRPMLREMPQFVEAKSDDFEEYAARVEAERQEERKRVLLLLSASDWP